MSGKIRKEETEHEIIDLLDAVDDDTISLMFKYLRSACLMVDQAYRLVLKPQVVEIDASSEIA